MARVTFLYPFFNFANISLTMDEGQILEDESPELFFTQPKNERTRFFLSKILTH